MGLVAHQQSQYRNMQASRYCGSRPEDSRHQEKNRTGLVALQQLQYHNMEAVQRALACGGDVQLGGNTRGA